MYIFLITVQFLDLQDVNRGKRQEGQTYDSWPAIVVNSILFESGIRGVTVSKRLLQAFKKMISSLHCAWKRAKGGNPWKFGQRHTILIVKTYRLTQSSLRSLRHLVRYMDMTYKNSAFTINGALDTGH